MKKKLKEILTNILKAKYIHLEEDASFCYSVEGDTLTIYFEWSNGKTDWKNNFDFPAKPYRDMEHKWFAHRGFLRVWKVIEPHLKNVIENPTIKHIEIAGYSHGAAIALLCHEYCKFNRPDISNNILGYGFGSPRVVWGFVQKEVKKRFEGFMVIRNGCDIVTHVPPILFGFHHVGRLLQVGDKTIRDVIKAHYADNYINELQ